MSRGSGKVYQQGAPTLAVAMEAYLARPKLRSAEYARNVRSEMQRFLGAWLALPLDEITRSTVVRQHSEIATYRRAGETIERRSGANHALRNWSWSSPGLMDTR